MVCVVSSATPGRNNNWTWKVYRGHVLESSWHHSWRQRESQHIFVCKYDREDSSEPPQRIGSRNWEQPHTGITEACLWFRDALPSDSAGEDTWATVWRTQIKLKSSVSRISPVAEPGPASLWVWIRVTEASVMSRAAWGAAVFQGFSALASLVLLVAHEGRGRSLSPPPLTAAWLQVGQGHAQRRLWSSFNLVELGWEKRNSWKQT